jgi:hypothetical protein
LWLDPAWGHTLVTYLVDVWCIKWHWWPTTERRLGFWSGGMMATIHPLQAAMAWGPGIARRGIRVFM